MIHFNSLREILNNERLPAALVDLDSFDANSRQLSDVVSATPGRTLRLASKSVRVPELLKRALDSSSHYQGLMCYSAEEALWLAQLGFDHFLIAYPTYQASDLACIVELRNQGKTVSLMTDSLDGVKLLAARLPSSGTPFRVLLDVDLSLRFFGGWIHLGVRRSPIRTVRQALDLVLRIAEFPNLKFVGIMGYEAQVAGLGDRSPFAPLLNPIAKIVRYFSVQHMARVRQGFADQAKAQGIGYEIINGGGTGSLNYAAGEGCLTELTAGSALLSSHLFDYYSNIQFQPALYFALQVVRSSDPGLITCQGGGYVSSGAPGWDKTPIPVVPEGMALISAEGCGEVQTPVKLGPNSPLISLGEAVLFRPAKAGELAERFEEYLLVSGGKKIGKAKTYRGYGKCFY